MALAAAPNDERNFDSIKLMSHFFHANPCLETAS
jgi:hypothetical protein